MKKAVVGLALAASIFTGTPALANYTSYVINCNEWISLREYPDTSAPRLTTIPLGASVTVIEGGAVNDFLRVEYRGLVGYALAYYIAPGGQRISNSVRARVVNCNEWISLREYPDTSAARLRTIPLGAYVTYLGQASNGFYKIRYDGVVGYALSAYLAIQ